MAIVASRYGVFVAHPVWLNKWLTCAVAMGRVEIGLGLEEIMAESVVHVQCSGAQPLRITGTRFCPSETFDGE